MATQTQTQTHAPWKNTKTSDAARPDLGMDAKAQDQVVQQLEQVLVDTYTLYLKTQNAHWNVKGPMFKPLHDLFEEHYQEMAGAVDDIAERITTLGHTAPATYKEFARRTTLEEWDSPPDANTMIKDLVKDHESVVRVLRDLARRADKADDEATLGLSGDRLDAHEKHAWMLRVHLV
jgi:starvation-inducible DNA-binding protein